MVGAVWSWLILPDKNNQFWRKRVEQQLNMTKRRSALFQVDGVDQTQQVDLSASVEPCSIIQDPKGHPRHGGMIAKRKKST